MYKSSLDPVLFEPDFLPLNWQQIFATVEALILELEQINGGLLAEPALPEELQERTLLLEAMDSPRLERAEQILEKAIACLKNHHNYKLTRKEELQAYANQISAFFNGDSKNANPQIRAFIESVRSRTRATQALIGEKTTVAIRLFVHDLTFKIPLEWESDLLFVRSLENARSDFKSALKLTKLALDQRAASFQLASFLETSFQFDIKTHKANVIHYIRQSLRVAA